MARPDHHAMLDYIDQPQRTPGSAQSSKTDVAIEHNKTFDARLDDMEQYLEQVIYERSPEKGDSEYEDDGWEPTEEEWEEMEDEAFERWAKTNGYAMEHTNEPPKDWDPDDEDAEPFVRTFKQDFDNYGADFEALLADTSPLSAEAEETMINPNKEAEEARRLAAAAVSFSDESSALLNDILEGASPAARQSIESLVFNIYGTDSAPKYLEDMRTPKLPDDCIDDSHWAKPLLYQYLRVLDNNPYYTPKQIETQLTQFARELSTDYYAKDEPIQLHDGTIIDDWPKEEDDDDDDDGYLN